MKRLIPPTNQKQEVWKPVKNYEGLYEVSNMGRVKSLPNKKWSAANKKYYTTKEIILKNYTNKKGYTTYGLHKNGKQKTHSTHQLVARAFIPNPKNKPTLNHKNEIKDDNRASNLEWMTIGENVRYGNGIEKRSIKKRKKIVQLSESGVFIRTWISAVEAEKKGGFNRHCISMCVKRKMKAHKYFIFRYYDENKIYLTENLIESFNKEKVTYLKMIENDH